MMKKKKKFIKKTTMKAIIATQKRTPAKIL
jgi:hypothetical protein